MLQFLADENFSGHVLRGLRRREPLVDVVRVQDLGLTGLRDPDLLEWAARQERVLLTHDVNTMIGFAYQRIDEGKVMPGIIEVPRTITPGQAIDEILVIAQATFPNELEGRVIFLPL